jgi:hypothetical protein
MRDELWARGLPTAGIALVASFVFLIYRYRGSGHPFGSHRARLWSAGVMAVLSVVSAGLGLGLPALAETIPPASMGLLTPAMLLSHRLAAREESVGQHHPWFDVVTGGVRLLLDRLEQQMIMDRDAWCDTRINPAWSLDQFEDAAFILHTMLAGRVREQARKQRLRSDYDTVLSAVQDGASAPTPRAARQARHIAEQALRTMYGRAFDWGYTDVRLTPVPAQRSARRRLSSAPPPAVRHAGRRGSS